MSPVKTPEKSDAEAEALKVTVAVPEPFCRFYKATLKLEASGETLEE